MHYIDAYIFVCMCVHIYACVRIYVYDLSVFFSNLKSNLHNHTNYFFSRKCALNNISIRMKFFHFLRFAGQI